LTSIITLLDITGIAQQIISQTYRAVEVFACAGAIYLAMNYLVAHLVAVLEHRLSPHLRAPGIETAVAIEGALH
jgi:octopine/nopaline transport system permease protein